MSGSLNKMRNAVRRAQRADLLQLVLSPRRGRETASADPGQVAPGTARGVDFAALAEGDDAGSVPVGFATPGMGGFGAEAQGHALCRSQYRGVAAAARKKVGPRDAR